MEGVAVEGGVAATLSPVALQWGTQLGLAPEVLQNLGVLCEVSSAGCLQRKRFRRILQICTMLLAMGGCAKGAVNQGHKKMDSDIFSTHSKRGRETSTNFYCTNFLKTSRGPGHSSNIPGTSQVPSVETQGKQTSKGGQPGKELLTPTPSSRSPPPHWAVSEPNKLIIMLFFSCLIKGQECLRAEGRAQNGLSTTTFWTRETSVDDSFPPRLGEP